MEIKKETTLSPFAQRLMTSWLLPFLGEFKEARLKPSHV